jgi:hypothetical protein
MKCPKCGEEMYKMQSKKDCFVCESCGESPMIKPNPSPQDIFKHIHSECERKGFDEFMSTYVNKPWNEPFSEGCLARIRRNRPDWYTFAQNKGLLAKKMVRREAWVNVYFANGNPCIDTYQSYKTESEARAAVKDCRLSGYIKTILLHSWEEEEK